MTADNRTNEGVSAKAECTPHHWVSHHQVGLPVRWIEQCSLCGSFNAESLREQIYRSGGQFADAMVEAAAKIIRRASLETTADPGDFWSDCYEGERERWRESARAALVAAQGAAPQAESVSKSSYISPSLPAQIRGLYRADLRERSIQTMLDLAGDLIQELIDLKAAQVLPSGGVDETKEELEGSARAAVRLLIGFTDDELDELGGFEEEKK